MFRGNWEVTAGEVDELMLALYVRDVAGPRPTMDPVIPPLTPSIARRDDLPRQSDPEASAEWALWWAELRDLTRTPEGMNRLLRLPLDGQPELADKPILQNIARVVCDDAVAWISERKSEYTRMRVGDLPGPRVEMAVIRDATRRRLFTRPFSLFIAVLPVATKSVWRVDTGHYMVAASFVDDVPTYRAWLRPVVRELIQR